jgi:hypothetical protein
MADIIIKNIILDVDNSCLKIWANVVDNSTIKLTDIYIDTERTFLSASEPSSKASYITLSDTIDLEHDSNMGILRATSGHWHQNPTEDTSGIIQLTTTNEEGEPVNYFTVPLSNFASGILTESYEAKKTMFFVFIKGLKYNNEGVTQEEQNIVVYSCGVTFNQNDLYQTVFDEINHNIIKGKGCPFNNCTFNKGAADIALLFDAFQLSWSKADPRQYVKYWNYIHNVNVSSNCRCNG